MIAVHVMAYCSASDATRDIPFVERPVSSASPMFPFRNHPLFPSQSLFGTEKMMM
jgi:hypothetical protein